MLCTSHHLPPKSEEEKEILILRCYSCGISKVEIKPLPLNVIPMGCRLSIASVTTITDTSFFVK